MLLIFVYKNSFFGGPFFSKILLACLGIVTMNIYFLLEILQCLEAVADLGGGWGGCTPPTSLKVTILAKKSASISNNSAPIRDASPPPAAT